MSRIVWILALVGALCASAAAYYLHTQALAARTAAEREAYTQYVAAAHRAERAFIESLPIYQDYTTPAKEARLRTYLLNDHLAAAAKFGVEPVADQASVQSLLESGALLAVENTAESGFFYYNVSKKYRYLTPGAARGLEQIAQRLQQVLRERVAAKYSAKSEDSDLAASLPFVKFAVSSALRPLAYQARLRGRNANASLVSSHSQGVSFDIFYDEYYVRLPDDAAVPDDVRRRLGFWLGAALRRQFRAALTETLLQLQDEGLLYAILEKNQRCYHVTILLHSNSGAEP